MPISHCSEPRLIQRLLPTLLHHLTNRLSQYPLSPHSSYKFTIRIQDTPHSVPILCH